MEEASVFLSSQIESYLIRIIKNFGSGWAGPRAKCQSQTRPQKNSGHLFSAQTRPSGHILVPIPSLFAGRVRSRQWGGPPVIRSNLNTL